MKLTTILFDLDGTLLPMDNDAFTKGYFKLLVSKMAAYGYEPKRLIDAVWTATASMVKNNGTKTNEDAFWLKFSEIYGEKALSDKYIFDEFYENEFQNAKELCGYNPKASEAIQRIKEAGLRKARGALCSLPVLKAYPHRYGCSLLQALLPFYV